MQGFPKSPPPDVQMFRRLLVPVDFTAKTAATVDLAARLVGADGDVTLIHVVQSVPGIDLNAEPDFYERLASKASEKMSALGERLENEGIAWNALLVVGNRYAEIIRAAEDGFDLLLVSSHRVDLKDPATGAATMSYRLAIGAPCAVLLLK